MPVTRNGVSSLRKVLREICKLGAKFPGMLTGAEVPDEIQAAVIALIAVCVASSFDDPHAGEITGQGTIP